MYRTRKLRRRVQVSEQSAIDLRSGDVLEEDGVLRVYPEVVDKGVVQVYSSGGRLVFRAGHWVGLVPINDAIELEVSPKMPVASIDRMLELSRILPLPIKGDRSYTVADQSSFSLLRYLYLSLLQRLQEVEAYGRHFEYALREGETSYPTGRINPSATMRRCIARNKPHLVSFSRFEKGHDTPLNRCVKTAIHVLAEAFRSTSSLRGKRTILADLCRYDGLFSDVALDTKMDFLRSTHILDPARIPDRFGYYRDLVAVCRLILQDASISFNSFDGEVLLRSLMVNMADLFEEYVRVVLRTSLPARFIQVLDGNGDGKKPLYDTAGDDLGVGYDATPDAVLRQADQDNRCLAVVEVKYKHTKKLPDVADRYQAISYAASYGCPYSVLVVPRCAGQSVGMHRIGTVGSIECYVLRFDISSADIHLEEERFVSGMADLLAPQSILA